MLFNQIKDVLFDVVATPHMKSDDYEALLSIKFFFMIIIVSRRFFVSL